MVQGSEFRVRGSGFRVQVSGFEVQDLGVGVWSLRFMGHGSWLMVLVHGS